MNDICGIELDALSGRIPIDDDDPRAVPSAMMAQAVGLPSEICSHCL